MSKIFTGPGKLFGFRVDDFERAVESVTREFLLRFGHVQRSFDLRWATFQLGTEPETLHVERWDNRTVL